MFNNTGMGFLHDVELPPPPVVKEEPKPKEEEVPPPTISDPETIQKLAKMQKLVDE